MAAAVAPDGTPYFAQDGTGCVNVFRGLNGEDVKNVFPRCCGYAESLAVDTTGLAQVAFFSNATPTATFLYEPLGADLTPGGLDGAQADGAAHRPRPARRATSSATRSSRGRPAIPTRRASRSCRSAAAQPAGDGVELPRAVHRRRPAHGARASTRRTGSGSCGRAAARCTPPARAATASTSARRSPSPCPGRRTRSRPPG